MDAKNRTMQLQIEKRLNQRAEISMDIQFSLVRAIFTRGAMRTLWVVSYFKGASKPSLTAHPDGCL
jgi:hypothetical protein